MKFQTIRFLAVVAVSSHIVPATQVFAAEELTPVVVSATRSAQSAVTTPSSITIITSEEIEKSGARHLAEILNTQASIQLNDLYGTGSRVQVSMRGFADNAKTNTLIMVDGRRLTNPDLGAPDLSGISLKDIKQIEIIQGSAGTLFGDQAVGGVINIITKTPEKYSAHAEVTAGSFNTRKLNASISNKVDNLSYRVSAESLTSDNFRDHNEQDYQNILARLDYQAGNTNWFIDYQAVDEELELPGAISKAQMDDDPTQINIFNANDFNDTETTVTRLGITKPLTSNWNLEAEYTQSETDVEGVLWGSEFTQERKHKGITPRIVGSIPVKHGETLVTLGIDYNSYDYDAFGTIAEQETKAFYLQSVIPLSQKISVTLGGRIASLDSDITSAALGFDDNVTVFEAGLSYQHSKETRLFARIDENYRFAKIDENTYTSPGVDGLDTQTGKSIEIGSEWKNSASSAKLVVYSLELDNEIDFDLTAPPPGPFPGANVNLDPTTRNGIDLEVSHQFNDKLNMNAQYSYIDGKFDGGSYDGNHIPFVAEHSLTVNAQYQITSNWLTTAEARYTGSRYHASDYDNAFEKLPSITVINAQLRYQQNNWTASLRINNLTDKTYAGNAGYNGFSSYYYPAPERNIMAKLRYDF